MRIFGLRIEQKGPRTFVDILGRLAQQNLAQRYSDPISDLRLEAFRESDGLVYLQFAGPRRGHGPGKMSRALELSPISLEDGENFGEDTVMVFDPVTRYAALQYNHYGPRSGAIEKYIYSFDLSLGGIVTPQGGHAENHCGHRFAIVVQGNARAKVENFGVIRRMEFSISVPGVTAADRARGRSLSSVLNEPLPGGVEVVTLTLSANGERRSRLELRAARQWINDALGLDGALIEAKVRGRVDDDHPIEAVDLIEGRLETVAELRLGAGLRLDRSDRWEALATTLTRWIEGGNMPASN